MLHANAQHSGFVPETIAPAYQLAWARHFPGERIGTAVEPIVAEGLVFIATQAGKLRALRSAGGEPVWQFDAGAPLLHAPAFAAGHVVAASAGGSVFAVVAGTGELQWERRLGHGGFAASPVISGTRVFIGARDGAFVALDLRSGRLRWQRQFQVPVRQTAAVYGDRVYIMPEDLRMRCLRASNGEILWTSEICAGQSARDYYPVVVAGAGRPVIISRTNPSLNMAQRIARDRHMLCLNAGVDDSAWQNIDAWTKDPAARGEPDLWQREQLAIDRYLAGDPAAATFFTFAAGNGERQVPPVLWIGGCQGIGVPPASINDTHLLVFYRSAYGNWNHGVAPLVGLGILNVHSNRIEPLFHQFGARPAWNTFWGTADEAQNFVVANRTVLIVHQGTLSGYDLERRELFRIWGERDTFGGFTTNLPWARNEWHGPARGGVAVVAQRLYWITGSRLLCLAPRAEGAAATTARRAESRPPVIGSSQAAGFPATSRSLMPRKISRTRLRAQLQRLVDEVIAENWAPLLLEPGLAGREFFFANTADSFAALARAYPHLDQAPAARVREYLARLWQEAPPYSAQSWLSLTNGRRREWAHPRDAAYSRIGQDRLPHIFGNTHAIWLYADHCQEWSRVEAAWPVIRSNFVSFAAVAASGRTAELAPDLFANRYLASLYGFEKIRQRVRDDRIGVAARRMTERLEQELLNRWRRAAATGTLGAFKGSAQLDPFISKGDGLSWALGPHRHKVGLFHELTPEVAGFLRRSVPAEAAGLWRLFARDYQTWQLVGEERQVHFGENYIDPPDFAAGTFSAYAWLAEASGAELRAACDEPFCRADLFHVAKMGIALERKD